MVALLQRDLPHPGPLPPGEGVMDLAFFRPHIAGFDTARVCSETMSDTVPVNVSPSHQGRGRGEGEGGFANQKGQNATFRVSGLKIGKPGSTFFVRFPL